MKNLSTLMLVLAFSMHTATGGSDGAQDPEPDRKPTMDLGAFSISLAVKDLSASREFYGKLGFEEVMGEASQNWLILRNGTTTIGLFQGMFERNIMTFNPGWTSAAEPLAEFTDVREIQGHLTSGPASLVLVDPDGNPILFDQHVE